MVVITVVRLRSLSRRLLAFDRLGPIREQERRRSARCCDARTVDTSRQPNSVSSRHGSILMRMAWIQKLIFVIVTPSSSWLIELLTAAMVTRSYVVSPPLLSVSDDEMCTRKARINLRTSTTQTSTGWPKKVSHYRKSSLNRIKNRQPG